jgi:hypothetical protein
MESSAWLLFSALGIGQENTKEMNFMRSEVLTPVIVTSTIFWNIMNTMQFAEEHIASIFWV